MTPGFPSLALEQCSCGRGAARGPLGLQAPGAPEEAGMRVLVCAGCWELRDGPGACSSGGETGRHTGCGVRWD